MKSVYSILLFISLMLSLSTTTFAEAGNENDLKGADALEYYSEHLGDEGVDAYEKIGTLYREGLDGITRDYQTSIEWYQKGIDAGEAASVAAMGYMYLNGFGVYKDYDAAKKCFEDAAEQNNGYALYQLGRMYETGTGVEQSDDESFALFQKAADAGYDYALLKLGEYYIYIKEDVEKGLKYYDMASEAGVPAAQRFIGAYIETTEGPAKALPYYEKAAEMGDAYSMYLIGLMYYEGIGVQQSISKATEWLQKGADAGVPLAMSYLADIYYIGYFGNVNPGKAQYYYTEAAARGEPWAMWAIAKRFHAQPTTGYDGSKDEITRVLEWYGKAIETYSDADNQWIVDLVDGLVANHVTDRETADRIIKEQREHFRLD